MPVLLELLAAIELLSWIGTRREISLVAELLGDSEVAYQAARLVEQLAFRREVVGREVEALLERLRSRPDAALRSMAGAVERALEDA